MHCSTRRSPGSGPMTVTLCLLGLMILQVSSLPTPKVQRDDPSQPEIWPVSNICGFQTTPAANCDCDSLLDHDARDAYCTIYKMTEKRHEFWDSFSTQSRLINVRFVVDSSHGQLDYVPVDAFPHLKALKVLEIRGASIETLEANTFESLKQLTELKLTGNRIRHIRSNAFNGLSQLTTLDLSGNSIVTVEPGAFNGLHKLRVLRLNSNRISSVADSLFASMPQLRELDLSDNAIRNMTAKTFDGTNDLKSLKVRNNQLTTVVDYAFWGKSQLRQLDLSSNKITTLERRAFEGLPQLNNLSVALNELKQLEAAPFEPILPRLLGADASFEMSGNPYRCECPTEPWHWVSKFYSDSNSEKVRDAFKNVTCTAKKGKVTFNHSIAGVNHTAQCLPEATTKKPSVDGSEVGVSSINNSTYYALIGLGVFMIICVVIAVCFPIRSLC